MIFMWFTFPMNAHQSANQSQSEVCLHTEHSVHFHPASFTRPSFSIFEGSGSETRWGVTVVPVSNIPIVFCQVISGGQRMLSFIACPQVSFK